MTIRLRYMSPECARGEPYNAKADVYSVALLIHELYSLQKPYDTIPSEMHDQLVFYQAIRPELPTKWSLTFRNFLQRGWAEDLKQRPSIHEFQNIWQRGLKAIVLADKKTKYARPWKKPNPLPLHVWESARTASSVSDES